MTHKEDGVQSLLSKVQYRFAQKIFCELDLNEIEYAVIKGCPLAYYKTGNMGTRLSSDIDVLISRKSINGVSDIVEQNGFLCSDRITRAERIMLVSHSHQLPSYYKSVGNYSIQIDINFDLFWGEYTGKRIDVAEFISDTVEMEIYGCQVKTLPPLKTMIQLILHHYKEMNSLYHLTGHVAIKKRFFEDVYLLCQRFPEEISVRKLYEACCRYAILPYAYYIFYYTRKIYDDKMLDVYLEALQTEAGGLLLEYYGLAAQERRRWKIPFEERLDQDVSDLIYSELTESDIEKLERNRRLFG